MKSDHWFYGIFRDCPWLLFRLMGLPESQAAEYQYDAVELKAASLRLDGIFRPQRPDRGYFFLEAQLYKDGDFYRNWLAKIVLYALQYRIEESWRGLVLFGSRNQEPKHFSGLEEWLASGRIQRVFLDELPEYPDSSLAVAVLKLAVARPDELVEKACRLGAAAKNLDDSKKLLGIIESFLVSNSPHLTRKEIQAMLQLNDIRESTIFQEGREEGRREEKLEIIARLLENGRSIKEICDFLRFDEELVEELVRQLRRSGQILGDS